MQFIFFSFFFFCKQSSPQLPPPIKSLFYNGQLTFDGKWEKAHGHCGDLNAVTPTCPLLLEMSRQSRCSSDDS